MPALITHYLGGQSALQSLCPKIRGYIAPMTNLFNLGTQGPDIFFYYVSGFITKRIRGVGTQMHNQDLGRFFMHMADTIKESKVPSQKRVIFAYTAGFLAHYAMDVTTHAFVYAKTHNPQDSPLNESTCHRDYEAAIDVLMLRRMRDIQPSNLDQSKLITPEDIHKKIAATAMAQAIRDTYDRDIHPWDVYRAMGQMAGLTHYLESKTGKRKLMLGMAETVTIGSKNISALIHKQAVNDNQDYLNINKAPWQAPWDEDNTRNESFLELFDTAIAEAAKMIQALYSYAKGNIPKEKLAAIIANRSLKTGQNPENTEPSETAPPAEPATPRPQSTPEYKQPEDFRIRPKAEIAEDKDAAENQIAAIIELKEEPAEATNSEAINPEATDIEAWLDTIVKNASNDPPA